MSNKKLQCKWLQLYFHFTAYSEIHITVSGKCMWSVCHFFTTCSSYNMRDCRNLDAKNTISLQTCVKNGNASPPNFGMSKYQYIWKIICRSTCTCRLTVTSVQCVNMIMWSEFACSANQHPKTQSRKKSPQTFAHLVSFSKMCLPTLFTGE